LIQRNFGSKRPIWVDVREHTPPLTQIVDSDRL
jgi:hypothetical protein